MKFSEHNKTILFLFCYVIITSIFLWQIIVTGTIDSTVLILLISFVAVSLFPLVSELKLFGLLTLRKEFEKHRREVASQIANIKVTQITESSPRANAEVTLHLTQVENTIKELNGKIAKKDLKKYAKHAIEYFYAEGDDSKNVFYKTCWLLQDKLTMLGTISGLVMRGQNAEELAKELYSKGLINVRLYNAILTTMEEMSSESELESVEDSVNLAIAVIGAIELEFKKIRDEIDN